LNAIEKFTRMEAWGMTVKIELRGVALLGNITRYGRDGSNQSTTA
jgi:hypothetical protein